MKAAGDALFDGAQTIGWARFISTVGVTSIVTLAGGYWIANYVVDNQHKILDRIEVVVQQNIILADKMDDRRIESQRNDAEFMFYARVICTVLTDMQGVKANICISPRSYYPEASPDPREPRTP